MKSKNVFTTIIIIGISLLALWGVNRTYTYLTSIDSIVEVKVDENGNVEQEKEIYTEEELLIQRLSSPRAGDIYLIKEAIDSFSFFQNLHTNYQLMS